METAADTTADPSLLPGNGDVDPKNPFSQQLVMIAKAEHIELIHSANYWEAQHAQLKKKCVQLEQENQALRMPGSEISRTGPSGKKERKTEHREIGEIRTFRLPSVLAVSNRGAVDMAAPPVRIYRSSMRQPICAGQ